MIPITEKCYKATAFDGSESLIPVSQVFGLESLDENKESESWWISSWILSKTPLQHSQKEAWFDCKTRKMLPCYKIKHHIPKEIKPQKSINISPELLK